MNLRFPRMVSLKSRLIVLMTATSVILLALFIAYTFFVVRGQVRERIRDQLAKSRAVASFILEDRITRLKSLGEEIKEDEILQTVLTLGLTSKLSLYKENLKKRSGVSFAFFTDMHGRSVDWDATFLSFDAETGHPFIERALLGLSTTGYTVIRAGALQVSDPFAPVKSHGKTPDRGLLAMVTASPLTDIKGNIIAVFVSGHILDLDISLMRRIKNLSGADWAVVRNRRFIAGSIISPMGDMPYDARVVDAGDNRTLLNGRDLYHTSGISLSDYRDDALGRVVVLISDKPFQALRERFYYVAVLILAAGLGLSVAIAFFFSGTVIRPLKTLGGFTYKIAEGAYHEEIPVRRLDEVGQLTRDFNRMAAKLSEKRKALDETNRRLVQMAHQSGMAEIAESVLHNIGNTINPVSVRIDRLTEKISPRESQILEKVYGMMRSEDRLPETTGARRNRREKLLNLVSATADLLKNRNQVLRTELNDIRDGMNRIMEILSLQQKYAGLQEMATGVDLNALLKDATDILGNSFDKKGISLEFHTQALPRIRVEKNRMMNVLINILKNACESIQNAHGQNERKISIHTALEIEGDEKWVEVMIADTGSGLLPGDIDKVFGLTYSTKGKKSGFGLHETANYIKSLNGRVALSSKGPGKGARFTLALPVPKS